MSLECSGRCPVIVIEYFFIVRDESFFTRIIVGASVSHKHFWSFLKRRSTPLLESRQFHAETSIFAAYRPFEYQFEPLTTLNKIAESAAELVPVV